MALRKLMVLVVESNEKDRESLREMFKNFRIFTTQEADGPTSAESKLLIAAEMGQPYDMVLVEWELARNGASKLLQLIRSTPRLKSSKIITMMGTANLDVVSSAVQAGANDVIVKPINPALLQGKLEKLLA